MNRALVFHGIACCHARFTVPLLWQQKVRQPILGEAEGPHTCTFGISVDSRRSTVVQRIKSIRVRPRVPPSSVRLVGVNCHAFYCCHRTGTVNRAWQECLIVLYKPGSKKCIHSLLITYYLKLFTAYNFVLRL